MRASGHFLLCSVGLMLAAQLAWPQAPNQFVPKPPSSVPLVLAGGTAGAVAAETIVERWAKWSLRDEIQRIETEGS